MSHLDRCLTTFLCRLDSLTYIPDRFAHFLFNVAKLAASEVGGFDPDKTRDQLRVAFQASSVTKKKKRRHDIEEKRQPPKKRRKRIPCTSSEDEGLREETEGRAFHDTLVDYEEFAE